MTLLQASSPYGDLSGDQAAGLMAVSGGMFIFGLIAYLFYGFCLYKVFQKAGREDAWAAFIPIYNTFVEIDIVKKPWWWLLLMFIPIVNIVIAIMILDRLSKFFGHGTGFTLGLLFFSFIFLPVLAFGDSKYNPNALSDDRS